MPAGERRSSGPDHLDRLRSWRVRRESNGLGGALSAHRDRLGEQVRRGDSASEAWRAVAPDWVRVSVQGVDLVRGTLRIRCASCSARYRVDRWMRDGGVALLRHAAACSIRGYRVVSR